MQTELRHYINLVTEATSEDLAKSLFSLVKHNEGKFKSEKQAKFLLAHSDNGEIIVPGSMSFGRGRQANPSWLWRFELDNEGVNRIVKDTSKNKTTYWERTEQYIQANRDRQDKLLQAKRQNIEDELRYATERKEQLVPEVEQLRNDLEFLRRTEGMAGAIKIFEPKLKDLEQQLAQAMERIAQATERLEQLNNQG